MNKRRQASNDGNKLDLKVNLELIIVAATMNGAPCRILNLDRGVLLRADGECDLIPGEIAVVKAHRQRMYDGRRYVYGKVLSTRLEISALELTPLGLVDVGEWKPAPEFCDLDMTESSVRKTIPQWRRHMFEMEQINPGAIPGDPDSDRIGLAVDLLEEGYDRQATTILMMQCASDLRCLDAHAHLGLIDFDERPEKALRHYEVGVRIGELSLGKVFKGVLPWSILDNRPFLRCLFGYGHCLWKTGRRREAAAVFEQLLDLNPMDNQGARFALHYIKTGRSHKDLEGAF